MGHISFWYTPMRLIYWVRTYIRTHPTYIYIDTYTSRIRKYIHAFYTYINTGFGEESYTKN